MRGIYRRFGATIALAGVDVDVHSGQVLALVGENGAGKSTLMKVLSGAVLPDAGEMFLDGQPFSPRNPLESRRAGVAMIYQELSLAPHLSVMENVLLGMEPTLGPFVNWPKVRQTAREALETLGRDDIPLDTPVFRLSIAQQQLVEIARALAVGCRVLVLDEPTSSLTQRDIGRLFELVRRLKSQGHAVVYISHFLEEVKGISDRFVVLRDGRTVGSGATAEATSKQIVSMMVGRTVEELYPRSPRRAGPVALEIRSSATSGHAAIELHRGEVLGIAGLIGAGRTELLQDIFGLRHRRGGWWALPTLRSPSRAWARGVGMLSEDRKAEGLALSLTIADNLTLSNLPAITTPMQQSIASARWIDRLGIRCRSPQQAAGDLSGGNQQKLALARLLHHDVDVLLLDEPTRGIDVASKAQIYQIIDQLACAGKAILMVSSYLPELLGVCDRIAVMHRGTLGPPRPVSQLDEHKIMLEATGAS